MAADGEVTSTEPETDAGARPALFDDEVAGEFAADEVRAPQPQPQDEFDRTDEEVVEDPRPWDALDGDPDRASPGSLGEPAPADGDVGAEPDPTGIAMVVVEPDREGDGDDVVVHVPTAEPEATVTEEAPAPRSRTSHVVLRHVRVRSVAKLSAVFYLCMCVVLLVAGVVLWVGASAIGVVANIESFIRDAGFDEFRFLPGQLLRAFVVLGLTLTVVGTLANILLAVLFNTLSDIVGGLRVTLAEDSRADGGR